MNFKYEIKDSKITKEKIDTIDSTFPAIPMDSLGFHNFIYKAINDLESLLNQEKYKDKNYENVVIPCYPNITDSKADISNKLKKNSLEELSIIEIKKEFKLKSVVVMNSKLDNDNRYNEQYRALELVKNFKKNKNCIIKIYDTFTNTTLKMLLLLKSMYKELYVYSPIARNPALSDRYIVGIKFKKMSKDFESLKKVKNFIFDIYPDYRFTKVERELFIKMNTTIANQQQLSIHNMLKFINGNNYFGADYHKFREIQLETQKKWLKVYA